jgi:hypothetical protein
MAVLTINQKLDQVNNFINSIKDSKNSYYFFIGKAEPWRDDNGNIDETKVPEANNSISQIEQNIYKNLVYGKLLDSSDIISMSKRYNWTNNTIYARYDNNDPNIFGAQNYVITDTNEVYKCIYNGYSQNSPNGVPSIVKPSVTQTSGTFTTFDGYIWKYMFTCDPTLYTKFQSTSHFPITPNTEVIENAVPGTIDSIRIVNGGENYQVFEEGFISKFVNNYVIELPSTSSPYDNHYVGSTMYLKAGFGGGQIREIVDSSGLYKTIAVHPPFNYYENLKLKNVNGVFSIGDLVTQNIYNIKYIYEQGYINLGDTLVQSDTGWQGKVVSSNSSVLKIETDTDKNLQISYPIIDTTTSNIKKSGKIDVYSSNFSEIVANTSTNFEADYSVGGFVQIDEHEYLNTRRITSIVDPNYINKNITANTNGVNSTDNVILLSSANSFYNVGDLIYYTVPTGNTAVYGLAGNSNYYISFSNTSSFAVSETLGGANVNLTESRVTPGEIHKITYYTLSKNIIANTSVVNSTDNVILFPLANTFYSVKDKVFYGVPTDNTAIYGLTSNTFYYISFANSSSFALSETSGGANINLTETRTDDPAEIHSITVYPYMVVDQPFKEEFNFVNNYLVPTAVSIDSFNNPFSEGSIVYVNLNSAELSIENIQPQNQNFILGESLIVVDSANNSQFTNGTVSFTNTSTVILSDVNGSNFNSDLYLYGLTSKIKANIVTINTNPNITVETIEGGFVSGATIFVKTVSGTPTANATVISKYSTPNDLTEYVISPKVNIDGDGNGALAFCTVDLSSNNPTRAITSLTLINGGQNYTRANVTITSNTLYGTGAILETLISPIYGHGANPYLELNAVYSGISKKFDTSINESFHLPSYGSYRNIGVIKNPYIEDVIFEVDNFDRATLKIDNTNSIFFEKDEIVVQPYSNAAGVVVSSNDSAIEIKNLKGSFLADPDIISNTQTTIHGWTSGANAHVTNTQIKYFNLSSDLSALSEIIPGGTGQINQVFLDSGTVTLNKEIYANTQNVDSILNIIKLNLANTYFNIDDSVYYEVPIFNSQISGLTANSNYYISFVNSSSFALSETLGGANVDLTETRVTTPADHYVTANTDGVNIIDNVIYLSSADSYFSVNDILYYTIPTDNTAISGLDNETYYYVSYVNSSSFAVSETLGGANVDLTETRTDNPGENHTFTISTQIHYMKIDVTNYELKNTKIRVTDVIGSFSVGDKIFEPSSNTYADITGILTSNGNYDASSSFGKSFNQTARITLSSNTKPYELYEYVYQTDTYATGQIISTRNEIDFTYNESNNFVVGDSIINDTTGANGIISYVDTTINYIKLTSISTDGYNDNTNRAFNPGDSIRNSTTTKSTTINNIYSVIVLADVGHINNNDTTPYSGKFKVGSNEIIGYTSGASGQTILENSIDYPDLVKYSGEVVYFDNISKFDKSPTNNEQFKLIIKF